jgi:Methyltransferase domain
LSQHRLHVERNKAGFGDPAFHAMWDLLIEEAASRFKKVEMLEIGVYKGATISLWALISRSKKIDASIAAITPLKGSPEPGWLPYRKVRALLDKTFRERLLNGDFYEECDYGAAIQETFLEFELEFSLIELNKGYSSDQAVIECFKDREFSCVYVDGDHTYEGASNNFKIYGPLVKKSGWLVADDAGCDLPGSVFWKGHEAVSRAARKLPQLGFRNILNVGHNRIYERL